MCLAAVRIAVKFTARTSRKFPSCIGGALYLVAVLNFIRGGPGSRRRRISRRNSQIQGRWTWNLFVATVVILLLIPRCWCVIPVRVMLIMACWRLRNIFHSCLHVPMVRIIGRVVRVLPLRWYIVFDSVVVRHCIHRCWCGIMATY